MRRDKSPFIEAALNLAWSHWGGLGVRGVARPPSTAVDPEALLYLTACLVEHDPRLQDEVGDWWKLFHRYISRPRMNALASRFGEKVTAKLTRLEATFQTATPTGKSRLDHLSTPARSLLRLRCALGANARAEVLLEFLTRSAQPEDGLTALALSEVGYSKRNIALVLDDLRMAGILTSASEGNRVRYRLADPAGLERALRPLPLTPGRWHLRLPVIAAFVELADRLRDRDAIVQGIEARKTLSAAMPNIVSAGIASPGLNAIAETYWTELQRWLIDHVIADDSDAAHRLARMIAGVWVAPDQEPRRAERASGAVLPRIAANPRDDRELLCLDLVQVPTVEPTSESVWAALSTAATTTYAHTIGLNRHEPWRFSTWEFGDERIYAVDYVDPLPHDRISRVYGKTVASRARADFPAVQLRLTRLDDPQ